MPDAELLILSGEDVQRSLPYPQLVDAMKQAFAAHSAGASVVPQRSRVPVARNAGVMLAMPAFVDDRDPAKQSLALKVVSVFAGNSAHGLDVVQAAVMALDPATGRPLALLEGAALTARRTAAASAAATDLLARRDCRIAGILGAGAQARAHAEALLAVRPIEEIRFFSRTRARLESLIRDLSESAGVTARLVATASARDALAGADILCTTTTSTSPLFDDADARAGLHINAVGAYTPEMCEVPAETVVRSLVVVDSRDAAWEEAGDLIQPLRRGLIGRNHIRAELGELVHGSKTSRRNDREITLFKSVGIAVQDAAAARLALQNAEALGLGTRVVW